MAAYRYTIESYDITDTFHVNLVLRVYDGNDEMIYIGIMSDANTAVERAMHEITVHTAQAPINTNAPF